MLKPRCAQLTSLLSVAILALTNKANLLFSSFAAVRYRRITSLTQWPSGEGPGMNVTASESY